MILVDNSQVIMSSLFAQRNLDYTDESLIRHMVLNTYRMYRKRFGKEYGELVLCQEGQGGEYSWRRKFFPHYKAARREARKDNPDMWKRFYEIMDTVRTEVREVFPYKNLSVRGCEADDVIAVLARNLHEQEPILILSGDKDFGQLQIYNGVKQYSPMQKKFVTVDNPKTFLFEHIVKGDSSDGVPNVLSEDDCFVTDGKRQKPVTRKRLEELEQSWAESGKVPDAVAANWNRNETLISHLCIPQEYQERIMEEWRKPFTANRSKILNYMISKGLKNLISDIGDF